MRETSPWVVFTEEGLSVKFEEGELTMVRL